MDLGHQQLPGAGKNIRVERRKPFPALPTGEGEVVQALSPSCPRRAVIGSVAV